MTNVTELLAEFSAAGITLEPSGDLILYRPLSGPTPDQLRRLKALKPEILAHLKSKTPEGVPDNADSQPESAPASVLSVPSPAVSQSRASYLEVLERMVERTPLPSAWPFGISQVIVVPPADGLAKAGSEAFVSLIFGGAACIWGIKAKLTPTGKIALTFPTIPGPGRKPMPLLKPVDEEARLGIEACIVAALRAKGFGLVDVDARDGSFPVESVVGNAAPGEVHRAGTSGGLEGGVDQ